MQDYDSPEHCYFLRILRDMAEHSSMVYVIFQAGALLEFSYSKDFKFQDKIPAMVKQFEEFWCDQGEIKWREPVGVVGLGGAQPVSRVCDWLAKLKTLGYRMTSNFNSGSHPIPIIVILFQRCLFPHVLKMCVNQ